MKAKQVHEMTDKELQNKLNELKSELFFLRFKNATNQLMNITATNPMRSNLLLNITWPYPAKVINKLEHIKSPTADNPLPIIIFLLLAIKYRHCETWDKSWQSSALFLNKQ